jgi:hypothetical protein
VDGMANASWDAQMRRGFHAHKNKAESCLLHTEETFAATKQNEK